MPFTQNKFGDLYGYGNLDTLFYFLVPCFILTRFTSCSISKRLLYSTSIGISYTFARIFFIKENKKKFYDFYKQNVYNSPRI